MQRLLNNWKLKLLSLVLAIGLWSHVRGEVNPWETMSFRVPLRGAAPARLIVLNRDKLPREVRVTLRAPRARLRELKGFAPPNPLAADDASSAPSTGAVRAALDFSLARLGAQDVPVKAQALVQDAEVIGVKPANVVVQLDRAAQQELAIEAEPVAARGYRIENVRLDRSVGTLFGPSKSLARVQSLRARVRSGPLKLNAAHRIEAPLEATDARGERVPEVVVEPSGVGAVAVLREEVLQKDVPLEARLVNYAGQDALGSPQVLPDHLRLRGPRLLVEKIGSLRIQVDASRAQEQSGFLQRRVQIELPPRVRALEGAQVLVRARIR